MAADAVLLEISDLEISVPANPGTRHGQYKTIVSDISFQLHRGEVLGLIGESGAGKSTIALASLAYARGACRITGGTVRLNGVDILTLGASAVRKIRGAKVAYVSQSAAASFNPAQRIGDQVIETSLRHGKATKAEARARAVALFTALELPEPQTFGERYPHQVSGGQLQRAMTAMAMCAEPDLIVFDEPTTALDVTTQIEVLAAIKKVIREAHTAALYITHDLAVVAQVADRILVLKDGREVEVGKTEDIIERPQNTYTRQLVNVLAIDKQPAAASGAAPLLIAENIAAAYGGGEPILHDVSIRLSPGQTLSVVGESGSGKSTLARVVTGLLPPLSGRVEFQGQELAPQLAARSRDELRRLQMIYQIPDTAMNPRHRVGEIIGRPLSFYFGIRGGAQRKAVAELLEQIELDADFAERYPAELSGGQKQRVCIARALAAEPDLVICDEVTSALDPLVADEILRLLLRLQRERNVAYLFITHDLATVRAISDSIAVMYRGRVVRYGPKDDVLAPPFDDYTSKLLASVPAMQTGWLDRVLEQRTRAD